MEENFVAVPQTIHNHEIEEAFLYYKAILFYWGG